MGKMRDIIAAGMPVQLARSLRGVDSQSLAVSAAGSAITDATALTSAVNLLTTVASNTGVLLPDADIGDMIVVGNGGSNAAKVYPPTSSGKINNGSAGAAVSVAAGKGGIFLRASSVHWIAIFA